MQQTNHHLPEMRARRALADCGLPTDTHLHRAPSTRNDVFLSSQHVIRINRRPNNRLHREALLIRSLPDLGWKPRIVASSAGTAADYLIVARLPGSPLSRWWPDMSKEQRREAVKQLATCLKSLHSTPAPQGLPTIDSSPQLIDFAVFPTTRPISDTIKRLRSNRHLDPDLLDAAGTIVDECGPNLCGSDASFLIHGDLTFENILWDGRSITGLLDFEWARAAPIDLDLDVLLRFCAFPYAHVAPDYEDRTLTADYAEVPSWMAEFEPELFGHPQLAERLVLYSLAFDLKELAASPPDRPAADLGPLHPYNRLIDLIRGESYVHRFLASLDQVRNGIYRG